MEMSKVKDFLEGIPSKHTRKSYQHSIKMFEKFLGKPIETLIKSSDAGKMIEKFYVWLKDKGYTQNSRRNLVNGAIQYLKFFDTPIKYRRSLGMYKTEITTRDHLLTVSEVQSMADVADLREKIILEVLLLGLRVQDACTLEWKLFDVLDQEPPTPILIRTNKEGIIAHTFISAEFKDFLSKYLPQIDKNNKYLIQTSKKMHPDEETLNWILKDLGKRANLNLRGSLHWHCGRKLFLRTCAENGINQWNAKMMCGKAVAKDIETYINGVQLKQDFIKISNILCLRPKSNGRITNLEGIVQLSSDALAEMAKPMIRKLLMEHPEKYGLGPSRGTGLVELPNLSKMSNKEILELYLKLTREEKSTA